MKSFSVLLFLTSLFSPLALASDGEFEFTVTASHNGVPIPESEIELKPFEPGSAPWHTEEDSSSQSGPTMRHRMKSKRANPIAYSNNWCGSVRKTTGTNKIKKLHAYFQHPGCSKRTGVTQYPQATAVWGGIDGDSWTSALLQAGTVCKVRICIAAVSVRLYQALLQAGTSSLITLTHTQIDNSTGIVR